MTRSTISYIGLFLFLLIGLWLEFTTPKNNNPTYDEICLECMIKECNKKTGEAHQKCTNKIMEIVQ
jgi:hypothetical protein